MLFKKYFNIFVLLFLFVSAFSVFPHSTSASYINGAFVTTWKTVTDNESITIPTKITETYNYTVDWGDSTTPDTWTGDATHIYTTPGTHTIQITGTFPRIYINNNIGIKKIYSIEQWGDNLWTSMSNAFSGCDYLLVNATDTPNLSNVTDMSHMFSDAKAFNQDISSWDVSNVTNMSYMFSGATSFNQDLSAWNISNVTNISSMFSGATSFNNGGQPLLWGSKISNITDFSYLFSGTAFNQDISSWDVSNVRYMSSMFSGATSFNNGGQPLTWGSKTINVLSMSSMFSGASAFNQDISNWDVSNVTDMSYMFSGASAFNQNLNTWNISSVLQIFGIFNNATSFNNGNQKLNWDISNISNLSQMFSGATSFNQDVSGWDILNVTYMYGMFSGATSFNNGGQPLTWGSKTINVLSMSNMFFGASAFNQDISSWDVSNVTDMSGILYNTSFNTANYDLLLSSWSILNLQSGVQLGIGDVSYSSSSTDARNILTDTYHWDISDRGIANESDSIIVNSLLDDGDGTCTEIKCTFRDALNSSTEGNIISFGSLSGTITLTQTNIMTPAKNITITGPGANTLIIDGGELGTNTIEQNYGNLSISGLTFTHWSDDIIRKTSGDSVSISDSKFINNNNMNASLINLSSIAFLTIDNSEFINNSQSTGTGAGVLVFNGDEINPGDITITNSTFEGNSSSIVGGMAVMSDKLDITNSTFVNNTADLNTADFRNNSVITFIGTTMNITNSTFYNNLPNKASAIGTIWIDGMGMPKPTLAINNSIFYSTEDNNCNISNATYTGGNNIDSGTSCGFNGIGDLSNTDPLFDAYGLADNDGPVRTIALTANSPAINAGNDTFAPEKDARDLTRSGISDIGAYEYGVGRTLSSIAITTPANKLIYYVGDPLNIDGMVITGTYDDSSTKVENITSSNVTGFDSSTPVIDQILTVTFRGKTTTYTIDVNIPMSGSTLTNLTISNYATKLQYYVGDTLDISGLQVTGLYEDGSTKVETITVDNISGFNTTTPINGQVLTVTVGGKTVTYIINVFSKPVPVVTRSSSGGGGGKSLPSGSKAIEKKIVSVVGCDNNEKGFNALTGESCIGNIKDYVTGTIPGCEGRTVGFSTTTGKSCVDNIVTNSPYPTTSNITINTNRTLKYPLKGDDVKELQKYLNTHGYDCGITDGSFGLKTKAAVILFQKSHNLLADGVVGPKTKILMK